MNGVRFIFFTVFIFLTGNIALATHLIGGEMQYECLGGDQYRITLKTYRDCSRSGSTTLDAAAVITIFRLGIPAPYENYKPSLQSSRFIAPNPSNPCLFVPEDEVCVEEGVYEIVVTLPFYVDGYIVSNQRCCRNVTLDNLVNPGNSGATFTIDISAEALSSCNNSPQFDEFPPIVICAGEDIDFPYTATDMEGDSIAYNLCSPLIGGGNDAQNTTSVGGIAPDPSTAPPYSLVDFDTPTYTYLVPITGTPAISIDPRTGLISGVPNQLGQFVVGVCVEEYRAGRLLSTTRRDFQFNVYNCELAIDAEIAAGEIAPDGVREILFCEGNQVFIENTSNQENVNEVEWGFDVNGTIQIVTSVDLSIELPSSGTYNGYLVLNPSLDCSDTLDLRIIVGDEIKADFDILSDLCSDEAVDFDFSGSGPIDAWSWSFGDGGVSSVPSPSHEYGSSGSFDVRLNVMNGSGCEDFIEKTISWTPIPEGIRINSTEREGCVPFAIEFSEESGLLDESYSLEWDFGNGQNSSALNPSVVYTERGLYSVALSIESNSGCIVKDTFFDYVKVATSPVAIYSYLPVELNGLDSEVTFLNESIGASAWFWDFGNGFTSIAESPVYAFPDTGLYEVKMIAFNESGCSDTMIQTVDIAPNIDFYFPNAFTPNGDGKNDVFKGKGNEAGLNYYRLTIWSRYGEMLFESNRPEEGWNGRHQNSGRSYPLGVYIYKLEYHDNRGNRFKKEGFATLVR